MFNGFVNDVRKLVTIYELHRRFRFAEGSAFDPLRPGFIEKSESYR